MGIATSSTRRVPSRSSFLPVRLYARELVLRNFVGVQADQILERMVELSLRTEEHL